MRRKLGINANCIQGMTSLNTLDFIKDAGFDCFFTPSSVTHPTEIAMIREKCEKLGLRYDFIHAPYKLVNAMWAECDDTAVFMQEILQAIDNAAAYDVPTIILHSSSSWTPPPIEESGLRRFDTLIEYAEKKGVNVAFENLRVKTYYQTLLERYKAVSNVGFCYDNGHEHWCSPETPHIQLYKDRLLCTHIHDNLGKLENYLTVNGDLHLLPFEGNFNFAKMMHELNACGYTGALTLEVRPMYATNDVKSVLDDAYARLEKISKM